MDFFLEKIESRSLFFDDVLGKKKDMHYISVKPRELDRFFNVDEKGKTFIYIHILELLCLSIFVTLVNKIWYIEGATKLKNIYIYINT